jgi:hypothetical protein
MAEKKLSEFPEIALGGSLASVKFPVLDGSANKLLAPATLFGQYGARGHFSALHLANVAATNTATALTFNTNDVDSAYGITHSTSTNPTRFVVAKAGTYELNLKAVVGSLTVNPGKLYFWLRKNGTDLVANSATEIDMHGVGISNFASASVVSGLVVNDYIEVMYQATNNSEYSLNFTTATGGRPNIPAVSLTIKGW